MAWRSVRLKTLALENADRVAGHGFRVGVPKLAHRVILSAWKSRFIVWAIIGRTAPGVNRLVPDRSLPGRGPRAHKKLIRQVNPNPPDLLHCREGKGTSKGTG